MGILNQWMEARNKEVSPEQFFEEYTNIKRAFNLAEKHLEATLPTNNPLEDVENYVQAVKEIALAEVLAKNRVDSEKDPLFKLRQKCISLFSNVKETFKKLLDNDPQKQQQATTTQQVPESLEKEKDVTSNREAQQPEQNSPTPDCNRTENLDNNKNSPSYNPRELEKILKYLVAKLKAQHFQGSYVFEIEVDKQKVFKGVLAESPTIDRLKPEQLETLQLAFTQPDLVKEEITISIDGQKVFQLQHGIIKCDLCGLASPQKQAEVEINPDPRGQGDNLNERVVENSNKTEVADLNQASSTQSNQHQVHKQESSTSNLAQHGVREEKSTTTPAGDDRLLAAWSKCYSNEGTSAIQKTMIAVNRALSDGESPEVVKQMILNYDPSWATEEDKEILSQRADLIIDKVYYQISQNENIDRDDPKETKHQKESHNELQRD